MDGSTLMTIGMVVVMVLGRVLALIFQGLRAEIETEPRAPRGDQA
jgi:Na+-transporting methylmalonyl-CoA/oxaloacetate decarboxylase gamma subunit